MKASECTQTLLAKEDSIKLEMCNLIGRQRIQILFPIHVSIFYRKTYKTCLEMNVIATEVL